MESISRSEFVAASGINKPLLGVTTTERAWFRHGDLLGTVLLDQVDTDWSFVALARDLTGQHRCFESGINYPTQELAVAALWSLLGSHRGDEVYEQGDEPVASPPVAGNA